MRELDVGDIVYHEITNDVFWVSGNYYVGFRVDIQLNMDCVWCLNKKHNTSGILIPRCNLTYLPLPKHIDSDTVLGLRSIVDLIKYVHSTRSSVNEKDVLSFMNIAAKMLKSRPKVYKEIDQYRI